eukprot:16438031-Heterocapsa_arctica.AAC.1
MTAPFLAQISHPSGPLLEKLSPHSLHLAVDTLPRLVELAAANDEEQVVSEDRHHRAVPVDVDHRVHL